MGMPPYAYRFSISRRAGFEPAIYAYRFLFPAGRVLNPPSFSGMGMPPYAYRFSISCGSGFEPATFWRHGNAALRLPFLQFP